MSKSQVNKGELILALAIMWNTHVSRVGFSAQASEHFAGKVLDKLGLIRRDARHFGVLNYAILPDDNDAPTWYKAYQREEV